MKLIIFLLLPLFDSAQAGTLQYQWRKISGPSQYSIKSPKSAYTEVTNLVAGIYQFELKVTNSHKHFTRDTMVLTVKPVIGDKRNFTVKPYVLPGGA